MRFFILFHETLSLTRDKHDEHNLRRSGETKLCCLELKPVKRKCQEYLTSAGNVGA